MVGVCNNNNERLSIYLGPEGVNMAAQEFSKWALRSSFVVYGLNKALREAGLINFRLMSLIKKPGI